MEDLETLFKSNDLTVRVFKKYNPWPILLGINTTPPRGGSGFQSEDSLWSAGRRDESPQGLGRDTRGKGGPACFRQQEAETVTVSFESPSAEGSANIVKYFLDEGKSRLQEEALERATKNKKFIEEQIGKTVDALTRTASTPCTVRKWNGR